MAFFVMFLKYNAFNIIWAVLVAVVTLLPNSQMPDIRFDLWALLTFDKLAHSLVFFVLSFLCIIGFIKQSRYAYLRFYAPKFSLLICLSYGLVLELIQPIVSDRTFELLDVAANSIGTLLGILFFYIIYKI